MGRKPSIPSRPDRYYSLLLRVTGTQKHKIIEYAAARSWSLNRLVLYAVLRFIDEERGIPEPGPGQFSLADDQTRLQALLYGEPICTPCGKRKCNMVLENIDGMEFCRTCNIRVL